MKGKELFRCLVMSLGRRLLSFTCGALFLIGITGCSRTHEAVLLLLYGDPPRALSDQFTLTSEGEFIISHQILKAAVNVMRNNETQRKSDADIEAEIRRNINVVRGNKPGFLVIKLRNYDSATRRVLLREICQEYVLSRSKMGVPTHRITSVRVAATNLFSNQAYPVNISVQIIKLP